MTRGIAARTATYANKLAAMQRLIEVLMVAVKTDSRQKQASEPGA